MLLMPTTTGIAPMTNIAPTVRPKTTKHDSQRPDGRRLVNNAELAQHLVMTPQAVRYLEDKGVLTRTGTSWDLDECREKYITHLRSEYRKSPRAALEADLQRHKSRWLQLRIAKAEGELMPVAEFDHAIQTLAGLTLTTLSGWPARVAGTDLVLRRRAEALLLELRKALADECNGLADEREAAKAT
jgi:hypothetical protein